METKIACLVRTSSQKDLDAFVESWNKEKLFDHCTLFVRWDNATYVPEPDCKLHSIKSRVIFSDASEDYNSFISTAFQLYDFVLKLDVHCHPCKEEQGLIYSGKGFLDEHVRNITEHKAWTNFSPVRFRGAPLKQTQGLSKMLVSHGLCIGNLDVDALFSLSDNEQPDFNFKTNVIPLGYYEAINFKNTMVTANAAIFLSDFMKCDSACISSYSDVWSGIVMKKILDSTNCQMTFGMPYVNRKDPETKFPFVKLSETVDALHMTEDIWQYIDAVNLKDNVGFSDCMKRIGASLSYFPAAYTLHEDYTDDFKQLSKNMIFAAEKFIK